MKIIIGSITVISTLFMTNVSAVEALSTTELAEHCSFYEKEPQGVDAVFCARYIQGFIDGAVATDERVVSNIVSDKDKEETFSERAIRTRLGKMKLYGSTYYADFCLGEPIQLKEIATKVITDLSNNEITSKQLLASDVVYQTLRTNYPCKTKPGQ